MKQKTIPRYLLGLGVLVAIVAICTTLSPTARNAASTSPETAAPAISVAEIDSYLSGKSSPLASHGQVFADKGRQYDVDPRLVVAIAGAESTFGTNGQCALERNNAWGWGGGWPSCWQFDSWDEGIDTVTEGLRRLYLDGGLDGVIRDTIPLIGEKYCGPNCPNWVNNVTLFYHDELHGDLSDLTFEESADPTFYAPGQGGQQYLCTSGNCGTPGGHSCEQPNTYAWDFVPHGEASKLLVAVADGTVVYVQDSIPDSVTFSGPHAGNVVVIDHGSSRFSFYAHLKHDSAPVSVGQSVSRGEVIAEMGQSGYALGVHLHFSIMESWWSYSEYGYETASGTSVAESFADIGNPVKDDICTSENYCWDTTPPTGNITSPSSDSAFRDSLTATSDASDSESGVNRVDFYLYYDGAQHQQTDNDGGNGWSVTWDLSGVAEQSGMWLDAWIYDNCGNSHHTNVVSGLMIDRTNPSGGITSPSSNSTFSDSLTAISDATDDRSGVNRVDFYLYYDGAQHPKTDNNGSDGWSVTWDLSGVAEQSGMWLDAWIYDNAGNSHHTNVVTDLRIDRSAPTPTSTPEPGDTTPPTNPTSCIELNGAQNNVWQNSIGHPAFVWSGADGTGSDIAGYYHTFSTDPNGTSDYFTTSNTFDFDFSTGWPTGVPYYLRVRTKDTSGNLATEWKTIFIFKYDPVPPTVSFDRANGIPISASGQSVYSNVTNWTFEGTANDSGAGLDSIVFGGWGNNYGYGWNDTAGTSSPWSYSQNGLLGHNRIHFWSVDKAGNESDRKYIELYVDTAAPGTTPSLNGTMGNEGWYLSPVEVALNAGDNGSGGSGTIGGIPNRFTAGIGFTNYRIDGSAWQTYSGSFTVDDGTHTVDYSSMDTVGNEESTQSLTIKIDTNPPSGSLSINRGASTSYSLNVVLGPSASDGSGSGVSQMRFSNSNPDWGEWETYAPEKAWRLTDGNGSKTVYVQFQDTAGNISGYSASIFVDLYPDKPASQNYRMFKSVVGIGGEGKSSENYKVGNTTGQPAMGPAPERSQSSESFRLVTGYWAMQPWPLLGDFNHDCRVDIEDIMQVASRWRTSCAIPDPDSDVNTPNYEKMYDIDRDCDIDIVDIMKVVVHWGETCP